MAVLTVPVLDDEPWPSLGGQVCDFIETYLVFGPGDLRGQPARLDDEKRWLIWRMYEVYPQDHPQAGRRRFKRVALSMRKGTAKTELGGGWITICELHPDGPVRTIGWDGHGNPIGGPVTDPYIPMVAFSEEQSEELAYNALKTILEESVLARDFDIGLERIMRKRGDGKAVALATAPNSADGARTTFQYFDETHRLVLPNHKKAHKTMLANIPKRFLADGWSLETTTAYSPGEGSVAEDTMDYARKVEEGAKADSRLFFFHRQADERVNIYTKDGSVDLGKARAAVLDASGPTAEWSDIESILEQFADPSSDKLYLERVWLNRPKQQGERAFNAERWKELAKSAYEIPAGAAVTLGFDGAQSEDSTALVATEVSTGFQTLLGCWEKPDTPGPWRVPKDQVDAALGAAFERYDVWRGYFDESYWANEVAGWAGEYGEKRVVGWLNSAVAKTAYAVRSFDEAIRSGALSHDGSPAFKRHVGNACKRKVNVFDDKREQLWTIYKERPDSPHKIDAAMAAIYSWAARNDALAAGVGNEEVSVYQQRAERGESVL
jgi:hypothetical protein